jgi:hypothetical protein
VGRELCVGIFRRWKRFFIFDSKYRKKKEGVKMVVIEFAKSSRARCHSCSSCIGEGEMKFGTAISSDGYLNMQWHHQGCFWNKRVGKYFRRKGKKINYVLRVEQFSNREVLSRDEHQELVDKVLLSNLKHATDTALEKAGIARPDPPPVGVVVAADGGDEPLNDPPPAKKGRKRKAQEAAAEIKEAVAPDPEPDAEPEAVQTEGRMTRSRAKKLAA